MAVPATAASAVAIRVFCSVVMAMALTAVAVAVVARVVPATAAARALGIRVHAIGIGSRGPAVIPVASPLGGTTYRQVDADLDETTLQEIAGATGGSYFRADDRDVLVRVFREIDRLEKRPIEEKVFFTFRELYPPLLLTALAFLLAELVLRHTLLRRLP